MHRRPHASLTATRLASGVVGGRAAAAADAPWATASFSLDGSTSYVDMSGAEDGFSTTAWSFGVWCKSNNLVGDRSPIGLGATANTQQVVCYQRNTGEYRILALSTPVGTTVSCSGGTTSTNWAHLCGYVNNDGTLSKLYLNGVQIATDDDADSGGSFPQLVKALLGVRRTSAGLTMYWSGLICEAWMHPFEVTAANALALYNGGTVIDARTIISPDDYIVASNATGASTVTAANIGLSPNVAVATLINGDSADIVASVPS